jgi:hypothetical protein
MGVAERDRAPPDLRLWPAGHKRRDTEGKEFTRGIQEALGLA